MVFGIFGMKDTTKTLMEKIYENYVRNFLGMYVSEVKKIQLYAEDLSALHEKYEGNELQWHSTLVLETLGKTLQDENLDHEKLFRKNLEQVLSDNNREEPSERKIQNIRECIFKQKSFIKLKETTEEIFLWNKKEGLIGSERFQKEVYTQVLMGYDKGMTEFSKNFTTSNDFTMFSEIIEEVGSLNEEELNDGEAEKRFLDILSKDITVNLKDEFNYNAAYYIANKMIPELRSEPKYRQRSIGKLHEKYFETILNKLIMGLDHQKYFRDICENVLGDQNYDEYETLPHCVVFENAEPTKKIIKEQKQLDNIPILENPCNMCCDKECSPVALPKKQYGNLCRHLNGKILAFCSDKCGLMKWLDENKTCPCCRQEIRIKHKRNKGKRKNF